MSLTDALLEAGFTHKWAHGYTHNIYDASGAVVFKGTAHAVWCWLDGETK